MKTTPSTGQIEHYKKRREETLSLIREVVTDLEQTGTPVTRKNLRKYTGLSDGTFSLPHVKELLKELKVCQFSERKTVDAPNPIASEMTAVCAERDRLLKKTQVLERTIGIQKDSLEKLKETNEQLSHEVLLLRGKFQQAMELLDLKGEDLKQLFKE